MATITVKLPDELHEKLINLTKEVDRNKSH